MRRRTRCIADRVVSGAAVSAQHVNLDPIGGTELKQFIAEPLHHLAGVLGDVERHDDIRQAPQPFGVSLNVGLSVPTTGDVADTIDYARHRPAFVRDHRRLLCGMVPTPIRMTNVMIERSIITFLPIARIALTNEYGLVALRGNAANWLRTRGGYAADMRERPRAR